MKNASAILYNKQIPTKLKTKFYRPARRPAMLYGDECWTVNQYHIQKMNVPKMKRLDSLVIYKEGL